MKKQAALRLVDTRTLDRRQWLEVRRGGIGRSDAAAAVGLNLYKSPLALWMDKTGRSAEQEEAAQAALDQAAHRGFGNGAFDEVEEDDLAAAEEFFPASATEHSSPQAPGHHLRERLKAMSDTQPGRGVGRMDCPCDTSMVARPSEDGAMPPGSSEAGT